MVRGRFFNPFNAYEAVVVYDIVAVLVNAKSVPFLSCHLVSESRCVRIWKCLNCSTFESFIIIQNLNVSEFRDGMENSDFLS